ncbi:MAG: TlpA disulfide reductase family protein [Bacteroidales bacterium]|jgi:thiol-disulfide isomerase/thioredoxin
MQKKLFTLLLLLITISGFTQNKVIFKGTAPLNGKDKEVEVKENNRTIAVYPVKEDGTFSGELTLDKVKQLSLNYSVCAIPIIAKPGREITITFGSQPKTGKFIGSPETQYYLDMRFLVYPADPAITFSMPWHVYKKYQADALVTKMRFSEIFCLAYSDIPPLFKKEVEQYNKYSNYGLFIMWPQFYMNSNKLTEFKEAADWKAHLESLYENIEWNDPFLLGIPAYISFAEYSMNEKIKMMDPNKSFLMNAYNHIKSSIANKEVKEYFMYHYTNKYLKDESSANRASAIEVFKANVTNERFIAQIEKILADAKQFGSDAPAYDFTLEDVNGEMVTLSSFKGKVVYIDFWATWCAPCRAEIPHMNRMKEELKDNKDIIVICISTDQDRDKDKWKQMVKDMGMTGYQLFAGDKNPEIHKFYKISGIPHFTMIGKDGKIYKNMTIRPSNPQTKSVLLDLAK